jgi:hypothetical protein
MPCRQRKRRDPFNGPSLSQSFGYNQIEERDMHRIKSTDLPQSLGATLERAREETVVVTQGDRDLVVMFSAEHFAALQALARTARLTGTLTKGERAAIAAAQVPDETTQAAFLKSVEGVFQAGHS